MADNLDYAALYFIMCIGILPTHVFVHSVHAWSPEEETKRGCWIPWDWSCRLL